MGSVVVGKRHYDGALAVQSTPHYRTTFGDNRVKLPDVSVAYSVAPERGVKRCVATYLKSAPSFCSESIFRLVALYTGLPIPKASRHSRLSKRPSNCLAGAGAGPPVCPLLSASRPRALGPGGSDGAGPRPYCLRMSARDQGVAQGNPHVEPLSASVENNRERGDGVMASVRGNSPRGKRFQSITGTFMVK
ncbi:unnamed protein product [Arctogadus glacialis]